MLQSAFDVDLTSPAVAIRSFLRAARDEIAAEWNGGSWVGDRLSELLDCIGELAEHASSGEPPEATFAMARRRALDTYGPRTSDVSQLVGELSSLRACIARAWQHGALADRHRELAAVNLAIDAVIAASVARFQEPALAKLEALLAASPVGIAFLDRDLRYIRINEALAALNARSPAEHVGKSLAEVLPGTAVATLEPMLREVMESGEPVLNREIRAPSEDPAKDPRTYLATYFPVRTASGEIAGVGGIVTDVTDARRVEIDLRRVQGHMQSILEHTPAPGTAPRTFSLRISPPCTARTTPSSWTRGARSRSKRPSRRRTGLGRSSP